MHQVPCAIWVTTQDTCWNAACIECVCQCLVFWRAALFSLWRPGDSTQVDVKWMVRLGLSLPCWLIDSSVDTTAGKIHTAYKCYPNVVTHAALKVLHGALWKFAMLTYMNSFSCMLKKKKGLCNININYVWFGLTLLNEKVTLCKSTVTSTHYSKHT